MGPRVYDILSEEEGRRKFEVGDNKACTVAFDVSFRVVQRINTNSSKGGFFTRKPKAQLEKLPQIDVLKDVRGVVRPGDLLAVMGPSGSGKTSLLNCLSLRNTHFTGKVLYDGYEVDPTVAAQLSGFVQQQDMFMPTLTPMECLMFYAHMSSRGGSHDRIERLLDKLGLRKVCHTLIGGEGSTVKGISGGERKRLAIALELLSDPPILFLDEPTSGLDAYMAKAVVSMLRDMATKEKKVVVATIHQPSSGLFEAFSHVLLLGEGRTAYYGTTINAVPYFSRVGHICPQFYNPADFVIDLVSDTGMGGELSSSIATAVTGNLQSVADAWQASPEAEVLTAEIGGLIKEDSDSEAGVAGEYIDAMEGPARRPNWWFQFKFLLERNGTMAKRDPILTRVRVATAVFTGCLGGSIYYQDADQPLYSDGVQSLNGAMFFLLFTNAIGGSLGLLQSFPREAPVMIKEYGDGLYAVPPYFMARTLVELPVQVLTPLLQFSIMYPLVGFSTNANEFFELFLQMVMTVQATLSFAYIPGSAIADGPVAMTVSNIFLIPMVIFGGFMINVGDIPIYYQWLSDLSYIRYGYEGMLIAFYRRVETIYCNDDEDSCAYMSGRDVLDKYNFGHKLSTYWGNFGINCLLFVCGRLIAMVVLMRRAKKDVERGAGFV